MRPFTIILLLCLVAWSALHGTEADPPEDVRAAFKELKGRKAQARPAVNQEVSRIKADTASGARVVISPTDLFVAWSEPLDTVDASSWQVITTAMLAEGWPAQADLILARKRLEQLEAVAITGVLLHKRKLITDAGWFRDGSAVLQQIKTVWGSVAPAQAAPEAPPVRVPRALRFVGEPEVTQQPYVFAAHQDLLAARRNVKRSHQEPQIHKTVTTTMKTLNTNGVLRSLRTVCPEDQVLVWNDLIHDVPVWSNP